MSPRTPANVSRLGESGGALALGSFSAPRHLGEVIYLFLSQDDNHGGLAQLVERVLSMHEVWRSIRQFSIHFFDVTFVSTRCTIIHNEVTWGLFLT